MDRDPHNLESLLSRLNEGDSAPGPAGDESDLAELKALGASLRAAPADDSGHFAFQELEALADARRAIANQPGGGEWEMPEHLSACALCLEAFEAVLEGLPVAGPALTSRAAGLLTVSGLSITSSDEASSTGVPKLALKLPTLNKKPGQRPRWFKGLATAAVLALLCSVGYYAYLRSNAVRATDSGLAIDDGTKQPIMPGSVIPSRTDLVAMENTRAAFHDGTEVRIDKDTRLTVHESIGGDTTLNLKSGSLTASVAKQKPGRHFDVTTELGSVRVIGTKFSVSTKSENAEVNQTVGDQRWQSQHIKLAAVTVQVFEGTVSVSNTQKQEVKVTAGQTAVIREGEPLIDVSGGPGEAR